MALSFIFDSSKGETPETAARKRAIAAQIMGQIGNRSARNVGEGIGNAFASIGHGITANVMNRRADAAERAGTEGANSLYDSIVSGITNGTPISSGILPMTDAAGEVSASAPGSTSVDMTGNDVYSGFMDAVKAGGVTNPYALAAIAATGKAESGFDPGNVNRTWSDPSESGQAGTAGGIMSWRGPRYQALAATGDLSPAGQARFFLGENPQLIQQLKNAQSLEEAQSLMNNAWKFAGYNRAGGEAGRRLAAAQGFLPSFQGGGEVAATDPQQAFGAILPEAGGGSLSDEVAEFRGTPEFMQAYPGGYTQQPLSDQQFNDRFGGDASAMPFADAGQQAASQRGIQQQANPVQVAQATPQQDMLGGLSVQQLMQAASNPWLNENQRSVVNMLLQQKMQGMDPSRQLDMDYKRAQIEAMNRKAQGLDNDETFFGNPVAIQNKDGTISYGQIGNKGSFRPIQLGEGQSFAPPTKTVDTGTESILMDQAGNVISRTPKQNRQESFEKAEGGALGKAQGEAAAALPGDIQQAEQTIANVDALINSKGLGAIVGPLDQYRGTTFLGGEGRDALARLEQLQGGAFLQAFGMLKGGGQITEVEGIKAEKAMARMNRALDEEDFKTALKDFRDAVSVGVDKMRQKAGVGAAGSASSGKRLRFNPSTGELE